MSTAGQGERRLAAAHGAPIRGEAARHPFAWARTCQPVVRRVGRLKRVAVFSPRVWQREALKANRADLDALASRGWHGTTMELGGRARRGRYGARPTARLDWDKNKPEPSNRALNRAPDWLQAGGNNVGKDFCSTNSMKKPCFPLLVRAGGTSRSLDVPRASA